MPYIEKGIVKPNFFNSAQVQWDLSITSSSPQIINTELKPSFLLSSGFYNKAYNQFSDKVDISKLFTQMRETGKYQLDPDSGRLIEAIIHRKEIASDILYTKVIYHFICEEKYKEKLKYEFKKKMEIKKLEPISSLNTNEIYKEVGGKRYTKEEWDKLENELWENYKKKHKLY